MNEDEIQSGEEILELTNDGKVVATAVQRNRLTVVQAGSQLRMHDGGLRPGNLQLRNTLRDLATIVPTAEPERWVFAKAYPFSSLSASAEILLGYKINGREVWKIKGSGAPPTMGPGSKPRKKGRPKKVRSNLREQRTHLQDDLFTALAASLNRSAEQDEKYRSLLADATTLHAEAYIIAVVGEMTGIPEHELKAELTYMRTMMLEMLRDWDHYLERMRVRYPHRVVKANMPIRSAKMRNALKLYGLSMPRADEPVDLDRAWRHRRERMRKVHPDLNEGRGEELRKKLASEAMQLNAAYDVLAAHNERVRDKREDEVRGQENPAPGVTTVGGMDT